ncbi:hypothetical protein [Streptomyces sp. B6B3]|uniref:hypothetical protein n=1 Tax=Streptomyces sp. B6B3 TaxID=3153570 RepID=UPI00325F222F
MTTSRRGNVSMTGAAVETYDSRTPDADGWRGVPFKHPLNMADAGKHDGGPMPPEAPRPPEPKPKDK